MGTKPTNFHTVNSYDSLDWGYSGGRVTFVWEEAPGGAIEIQVTVDDAGADGRVTFGTNVTQGDVTYSMFEDAEAIAALLPGMAWPYALANGRGIYHVNAGEGPYDALTSVLDMFALSEKVRAFGQIELEIRDAVKTIKESDGALSEEFKAKLPIMELWHLHDICKGIVTSNICGWEGYHLSWETRKIWRVLDIFDEMDESDKEALGDGFLDDLRTALTPLEQIANGDYFVN